jgi:adenylylsulfate kinase
MTTRILIMGLPGAGKTTLALNLINYLSPDVIWLNADEVRKKYDDWDFSQDGRIRQSLRMRELSDMANTKYAIADFVCPLPEMRNNYNPHFTIWVDTIREGRFEDTNRAFVPPDQYDVRVTEQDAGKWARIIYEQISHKIQSSTQR